MSYGATVFNVMIAGPGDVPREKVIAREVVHEWNNINSADKSLVLIPVGWDTHSSPSMEAPAQAVINSQVLKTADLLIAIFWTRLGTPTGEYASGTVEEVERHIELNKPAMIYFSSAPVQPDSVKPEQYAGLVKFRDSLKSRGLVNFFDDLATFRGDLFRHLSQTSIRDLAPKIGQGGVARETPGVINLSGGNIVGSAIGGAKLSADAKELLLEAVKDKNGMISHVKYLKGPELSTSGRDFLEGADARTVARWEAALKELESLKLIEAKGNKREVFSITDQGYKAAEELGGSTS